MAENRRLWRVFLTAKFCQIVDCLYPQKWARGCCNRINLETSSLRKKFPEAVVFFDLAQVIRTHRYRDVSAKRSVCAEGVDDYRLQTGVEGVPSKFRYTIRKLSQVTPSPGVARLIVSVPPAGTPWRTASQSKFCITVWMGNKSPSSQRSMLVLPWVFQVPDCAHPIQSSTVSGSWGLVALSQMQSWRREAGSLGSMLEVMKRL